MSKLAEPAKISTIMPANVLESSVLAVKKLKLAKFSSAKLAVRKSLGQALL